MSFSTLLTRKITELIKLLIQFSMTNLKTKVKIFKKRKTIIQFEEMIGIIKTKI